MFAINSIVKGKHAGFFVVLGYRMIGGERRVQVKPYNPETGQVSYGEMAFTEDMLTFV